MNKDYKYKDAFKRIGFNLGRLVAYNKAAYAARNPDHLIIFNASIFTLQSGKVWFGDLNINIDLNKLQRVADELKEELFILNEVDARFNGEKVATSIVIKKAVITIKPQKGFIVFLKRMFRTTTKSTKKDTRK
jgi:hypothetical protein